MQYHQYHHYGKKPKNQLTKVKHTLTLDNQNEVL